uniref:DDE_Tnp_1_7 domain-containing protein n=1 Tax=Steinernema glaseri TaxID=37863 RepID=A0A1I7Z1N6_9BILA
MRSTHLLNDRNLWKEESLRRFDEYLVSEQKKNRIRPYPSGSPLAALETKVLFFRTSFPNLRESFSAVCCVLQLKEFYGFQDDFYPLYCSFLKPLVHHSAYKEKNGGFLSRDGLCN